MNYPAQSPPRPNRLHRLFRYFVFALGELFYPRIEMVGRERLPAEGPTIFVMNHPNGLIDPLILMITLQRPVSFLAKSTLFAFPGSRGMFESFGALPVYRRKDEGQAGGPHGDIVERNEATFARCRVLLRQGQAVALFPEGTTHSGSELLPLRTGSARIALSAEAETGWTLGLQIVPVALWYQNKTRFRSGVLQVVGEPFDLRAYAADYAGNEHKTVRLVTKHIQDRLDQVVLQAENAELLAAIPVVAAWVAPAGEALDLPRQHAWSARLLAAYEHLQQTDPDRLETIARRARRYADLLGALGIRNPWTLELSPVNPWHLARLALLLAVSAPLALAGFILTYLPYRLAGLLANAILHRYDTQISTGKLIAGSILVLLGWIVAAVFAARWLGGGGGLLLFLAAPILAYIALRWSEGWRQLYEIGAGNWLRLQHGHLVELLIARRRSLAKEVLDAVEMGSESANSHNQAV